MKCRVRWQILFGLVALLQFGCAYGKRPEKDYALMLQAKVENLIEKILQVIQEYYHQIRTELKCIPDEVPDTIIGTLKNAIDCVDQNERNYDTGRVPANVHKKAFLKCFSDAKTEVEETMSSIDPNLDYCPENMTEKTYQINVTTTFTKTFHINIKNGLEIMKKKVHLGNEKEICIFNQGDHVPGQTNQTDQEHESEDDFGDEDDGDGGDENKTSPPEMSEDPAKDIRPKGHHGKGHHFNGHPASGNESKDYYGLGEEEEEENFPGTGDDFAGAHAGNESSNADKNNVYRPVAQVSGDKGHASKEHHGKGHESKESPDNDHKSKEHNGPGHEPKESTTQGHVTKEHPGKGHGSMESTTQGHVTKERPGKGHEPKESTTQGHVTKERPGKGHGSMESTTQGHVTKERPAKGHGSMESTTQGHVTKERPAKGHGSMESTTQGHVTKERPAKGHGSMEHDGNEEQAKEILVGMNDSEKEHGGNESWNEDDVAYGPGQETYYENDDEYSDADQYDEESDSSGTNEDENGGASSPGPGQGNGEEPEAHGHHIARPDSEGFHGKGHESMESHEQGPGPAEEAEYYEDDDYDNIYEDDAGDDAADDEDINILQEGKQNALVNSTADHAAAHDVETKNKTKHKGPSSGHGPATEHEGNAHSGTDDGKFFFPGTTADSKFTTRPPAKLALDSPTKKPFHEDYYADPDTEPEDSNYGNEYYDASEKEKNLAEDIDKSLDEKLLQSKPTAPVAHRIKIKPRNRFKPKPSHRPQNSEKHRITLPKNWPKKSQPMLPSQSIISLSQSFLPSDL